VFDQVEPEGGRPSVSRPAVPDGEVAPLVAYLRQAPVVMAARSYAPDQLDGSRGERVPLTFHTDGSWVWAGAVAYYLDEHGVPPEPDLVAHIRARGFRVPEVDDDSMDAASAAVTGRSAPERVAPAAEPAVPGPPSELEGRLDELGVPPAAYRFGETEEGAWSMIAEEGRRWTVFRTENGERAGEAVFGTERQASAYLLASLLLDPPPGRPIEPLPGEPPLTLFQGREVVEIPVGAVVDRYGGDGGNLAYEGGTPFEARSLPPDWANRPFQAYRVERPLRALSGIAVPWFDQSGGGRGYFFERSVRDLLADGSLSAVQDA
jgi:hypothetical protein